MPGLPDLLQDLSQVVRLGTFDMGITTMPSQDGGHKRPKHIDNFRSIVAFESKGRTGTEP